METDERYQIENTTTFNRIGIQKYGEDDDHVDTNTDMRYYTVHDTEYVENKINKEITTVIG